MRGRKHNTCGEARRTLSVHMSECPYSSSPERDDHPLVLVRPNRPRPIVFPPLLMDKLGETKDKGVIKMSAVSE